MIGDLRQGCKSDSDDESGGEALRNDLSPHGGSYPSTNRHSLESEAGDRSYLFAQGSHCDTFEQFQTPGIFSMLGRLFHSLEPGVQIRR